MQRILILGAVFLFGVVLHAQTGPTVPIYNSIPGPTLPMSLPSRSFEAGLISEYGNAVRFSGTGTLTSVTVVMVTGAYFTKYNPPGTPMTSGWTHPITLNFYSVNNSSGHPEPGSQIGSVTQQFSIPWRQEP